MLQKPSFFLSALVRKLNEVSSFSVYDKTVKTIDQTRSPVHSELGSRDQKRNDAGNRNKRNR